MKTLFTSQVPVSARRNTRRWAGNFNFKAHNYLEARGAGTIRYALKQKNQITKGQRRKGTTR